MTMISIVDDDRFVREAMGDLVQSLGYEAATFDSAEHFLQSGRLAETSCLITDLQVPDLSGLALQSHLLAGATGRPSSSSPLSRKRGSEAARRMLEPLAF